MTRDAKTPPLAVRADGGASKSDFLLRFQADLLGIRVVRAENSETTALGAAAIAGLEAGLWDEASVPAFGRGGEVFTPRLGRAEREEKMDAWRAAVGRVLTGEGTRR